MGRPRSYAEVTAQQQLGLLDHGGITVRIVAECESEQVIGYLDGDEAARRQTRGRKAVASPEQIKEPGRHVTIVLSLGLLKLRAPPSMAAGQMLADEPDRDGAFADRCSGPFTEQLRMSPVLVGKPVSGI